MSPRARQPRLRLVRGPSVRSAPDPREADLLLLKALWIAELRAERGSRWLLQNGPMLRAQWQEMLDARLLPLTAGG